MSRNIKSALASLLFTCTFGVSAQQHQVPKISTRDEYRACLIESDKLASQLVELKELKGIHNQKLKQLQDEMNALVATQPKLDIYDEDAVTRFNEQMEDLNKRGAELNENSKKFNQDQEDYNALVASTNKRCAAMVVSLQDMKIVAKERANKK
ncbi:hypothetical protein H8K52_10365 [Undibacterium seohonense]|uniref:Uncharacterized protein n=1 Tax=Undibacterium seohonense TaxID=1344950 RepID=A0ABR6X4W9_9BURK|nr:hypothetical protein [Undibacterium seohonense]MBC3807748.1 hypothetical protein [Undibacterium seohonense]